MGLLDELSVSKALGKRVFENDSNSNQGLPSKFKRRKVEAVRDFPVNCGTSTSIKGPIDSVGCKLDGRVNYASIDDGDELIVLEELRKCAFAEGSYNSLGSPSKIKHPKMEAVQEFPVNCGATIGIKRLIDTMGPKPDGSTNSASRDNGGGPCDTDVENALNGADYVASMPGVPMRTAPLTNDKWDLEDGHAKHLEDDYDGQTLADGNETVAGFKDEFLKDEIKKLDELIAQAKEYMISCAVKSCELHKFTPSDTKAQMEALRQEEAGRDKIVAAECITGQDLNGFLFGKTVVVQDRISMAVQGKEISTQVVECQGVEGTKCGYGGIKCGEKQLGPCLNDLNESFSLAEHKQDGCKSIERRPDIIEFKFNEEQKELINLRIVKHDDPRGIMTRNVLKMFKEQYAQLWKKWKSKSSREKRVMKYPHLDVAERLKEQGMWLSSEKPFGHISGVEIGDEFKFRSELVVIGLHCQFISGIDYCKIDGNIYATSIVDSGRYENEVKSPDVLIYLGQGGNMGTSHKVEDQKLARGNLAMMNSMEMGYPIRVTKKRRNPMASKTLGKRSNGICVYVYDGLYTINKSWQDRDRNGSMVFKFELHRMLGQQGTHQTNVKLMKKMAHEICMAEDVSQGKENLPIRVLNGVDNDRLPSFNYTTYTIYPSWYKCIEPIGCNCVNGCSDSHPCPCVSKNGGEIPFDQKGKINKARSIVHECGTSCKCPPSCMNRVTQFGPKYQLEIFKTKTRGWGVRSRNYITSGSFICEYVGEWLRDKEGEQRIDNDDLFDIGGGHNEVVPRDFDCSCDSKFKGDGFVIDATKFGNIGRFIKHSCSPNLYAQEVLYDHDDERMRHVMFFAMNNIAPLRELTYYYNYKKP